MSQISPQDNSSIHSSFASFNGWNLALKPIATDRVSEADKGCGEQVRDSNRASQIWFYRYDCICNLMDPSICLDASQAFLGVTRLQAKKSLRIEAKKIN